MSSRANKTLSKKDDISLSESLALIKHHTKDRESGLIVPQDLIDERKKVCAACGKPFDRLPLDYYFGERFHESCVLKMCRGEKP